MKKNLLLTLILTIFTHILWAQAPESFNYQAAIKNNNGNGLASTEVNLLIEILEGGETGNVVYSENHLTETDNNGLIHLKIGQGQVISGNFSTINWEKNDYFTHSAIDINGGSNFETIAVAQLLSVPYALHANTSTAFTGNNIELQGNGEGTDIITLKNNNYSRIASYTANDGDEPTSVFAGFRSGGTVDAPTNITENNRITGIFGGSYANGQYFINAAMEMVAGAESGVNGVSSNIRFGTTNVGSTTRTEKMRIAENGYVGIGTATPNYKLDVNGTVNASEYLLNGVVFEPFTLGNNLEIEGGGTDVDLITLKNNNYSRIASYTANDGNDPASVFAGFRSGGTVDAPTNITENNRITGIFGGSYANGQYFINAAMEMVAGAESGVNGVSSNIRFGTTNVGSTTRTEKMRIAENGYVGIGTATPNYKLDVNGTVNASEYLLNGVVFEPFTLGNNLEIEGGGTDVDLITLKNNNYSRIASYTANDGNDPASVFAGFRSGGSVDAPTNITENNRITGIFGGSYANGQYYVNAAMEMVAGAESGVNGVSSNIRFGTTNVGSITRTEKMRITENGNVGIGTTAPKAKLQVTNGDIYIEDATSGVIMTSPNGNCWRMTVGDNGNPAFTATTCPQ